MGSLFNEHISSASVPQSNVVKVSNDVHVIQLPSNDLAQMYFGNLVGYEEYLEYESEGYVSGSSSSTPSYRMEFGESSSESDVPAREPYAYMYDSVEEDEQEDLEELIEQDEMLQEMIEKVKMATEEQEHQLKSEEEELKELYLTYQQLSHELEPQKQKQQQLHAMQWKNQPLRDPTRFLGCVLANLLVPCVLIILINTLFANTDDTTIH